MRCIMPQDGLTFPSLPPPPSCKNNVSENNSRCCFPTFWNHVLLCPARTTRGVPSNFGILVLFLQVVVGPPNNSTDVKFQTFCSMYYECDVKSKVHSLYIMISG